MSLRKILVLAALTALFIVPAQAEMVELAVNGGFETGNYDGWTLFPTGEEQFTIISPGAMGDYAARITNEVAASAAIMKQANVGVGTVMPGDVVTIEFYARGTLAAGGVAFAEFFSELEGGGVSASEILGGAPLMLDADPEVWTMFSFTTAAGPDVSGGVTLQLTATTGGDPASLAQVDYDAISIMVETSVATEASTWSSVKSLF